MPQAPACGMAVVLFSRLRGRRLTGPALADYHAGRFRSRVVPEDTRMTRIMPVICVALFALAAGPCGAAAAGPLGDAPSRFAKLDGIRVHYKSIGKGDTAVVLIHGWTCDLTFWRAQVPALAGEVRLV